MHIYTLDPLQSHEWHRKSLQGAIPFRFPLKQKRNWEYQKMGLFTLRCKNTLI